MEICVKKSIIDVDLYIFPLSSKELNPPCVSSVPSLEIHFPSAILTAFPSPCFTLAMIWRDKLTMPHNAKCKGSAALLYLPPVAPVPLLQGFGCHPHILGWAPYHVHNIGGLAGETVLNLVGPPCDFDFFLRFGIFIFPAN